MIVSKNLTIGYKNKSKQKIVASNINFKIEKGKLVAVLGENGIGKSTLLKTLSKVQKPISGEISINNKNLNKISVKELSKKISLVLTEHLPQSQLTVFELIALGRQPHTNWLDKLTKLDILKIDEAIKQTGINYIKNNKYYELSDGQLQIVLIARALAQDTEIIILDEPTAHLDLHHSIKIFYLLKKLVKKTDKTVIISTHQINMAIQLSDEILLLKKNSFYHGTAQKLILENAFENLFSKDMVNFNKELGQFVITKI